MAVVAGKDGVRISVSVKPGSRSEDLTFDGHTVLLKTMAQPKEGEANDAVVKTLAKALGVAKTSVSIIRGQKDREKVVLVAGGDLASIEAELRALAKQ